MPRKPVVCASGCGKPLNAGRGSLPEGVRTCRPCRRAGLGPKRTTHTRACTVCGAQFTPNDHRDRMQLTCSRACGQRRRLAVHGPATPRREHAAHVCEVCGTNYRRSYPGQRTCGRACGVELKARNRPPAVKAEPAAKTCGQCAGAFTGRRRLYCSAGCAAQALRAQNLSRYGKTPEEADRCAGCGQAVPFKRKRCDDCKRLTVRNMRKRKKRKDKARRRGIVHEPYTLTEIAERDRYCCQLCRRRVAMTQQVPHPKAPTIDHVLPIAAGGQDTRANVQLAHFECNWKKRDGGTQQLALVG